jgi:hypothetical protein
MKPLSHSEAISDTNVIEASVIGENAGDAV